MASFLFVAATSRTVENTASRMRCVAKHTPHAVKIRAKVCHKLRAINCVHYYVP